MSTFKRSPMLMPRAPGLTAPVSLYDVAVLFANLHKAIHDPLVGFEDADRTLTEMELALRRYVPMRIDVIESALWAANLLNEKGDFFHPRGYAFDEFLAKLLPDRSFDKVFNTVEDHNDGR